VPKIAAELGCSVRTIMLDRAATRRERAALEAPLEAAPETNRVTGPSTSDNGEPQDLSDEALRIWARKRLVAHCLRLEGIVEVATRRLETDLLDGSPQACRERAHALGILIDKRSALIKSAAALGAAEPPAKIRARNTHTVRED
jgi:hypothetical protein